MTTIIMSACILSIVVLAGIIYSYNKSGMIDSDEFIESYGSLTEGLRTKGALGRYWNILVLIRWLATNAILICLREHKDL